MVAFTWLAALDDSTHSIELLFIAQFLDNRSQVKNHNIINCIEISIKLLNWSSRLALTFVNEDLAPC